MRALGKVQSFIDSVSDNKLTFNNIKSNYKFEQIETIQT